MSRFRLSSQSSVLLTAAVFPALVLTSCDADKPQNHEQLKEVIDVQGTCAGDQAAADHYSGKIYRWQKAETGKVAAYGVLFKTPNSASDANEGPQPADRRTPRKVSFAQIDIDTDQPRWTLRGVSDSSDVAGAIQQPLKRDDTACEVEVVSRSAGIEKQQGR
jgi:hypothetical protein